MLCGLFQRLPEYPLRAIEAALKAFHTPEILVKAVMSMYRNIRGFVKTPTGKTDEFKISQGVMQGDTLAPFLFVMVLDLVLRQAVLIL